MYTIGQIFIDANGQILSNKIAIKSHCVFNLPMTASGQHPLSSGSKKWRRRQRRRLIKRRSPNLATFHYLQRSVIWKRKINLLGKQCDRLGDFSKFLATNFLTKVAQISINFLIHFLSKNLKSVYFLFRFWKYLDYFYSNIWSHQRGRQQCDHIWRNFTILAKK